MVRGAEGPGTKSWPVRRALIGGQAGQQNMDYSERHSCRWTWMDAVTEGDRGKLRRVNLTGLFFISSATQERRHGLARILCGAACVGPFNDIGRHRYSSV
jgi:hypothetical protein